MTATFTDGFGDLTRTRGARAMASRRAFPRIVTRPDVRINPIDPTYYRYDGELPEYRGRACGYGWFPFILRLARGDLLCLFTESSAHVYCPGGRLVAARSTDGGRTWAAPQVLYYRKDWINHPGYGHVQTSDGRIWVSVRSQFYDEAKGAANDPRAWQYQDSVLASDDDGKTWQQAASGSGVPRPAIEMSNGRILWTGDTTDERGDPFRATFLHREEEGQLVFEKREHPELGPTSDEWYVVETGTPGVLVCMMRQQQHSQFFATARSFDYGRTWTPWRESNVFMGPFPTRPMLRRMHDGTLLFTYGQRWIGRTFAVASHDGGETWDLAHRQTILHSPREYHKIWDSHYTDIARAEGNKWLAVDYVASPRKEGQKGVYGTFIDAAHFRDVFEGVTLAPVGSAASEETAGYWSFDELEGEFARDPVAANFGEIVKAERVPGRIGNALEFNGKNSYVMVYDDAALRLPKYFTLEAWIKVGNARTDQTILSKAPKFTLCLRGGKLALLIGSGEMISEHGRIPANRWVHVAVTFGMRRMYSRATFFVNGKEDSWVQPEFGSTAARPETFLEAMAQSDTMIVGGPLYQEFGRKNTGSDNLVIGMDNNLKTGAFAGLIDEVAIHQGDLPPERIAASAVRSYRPEGTVTSVPVVRPANARWQTFHARTTTPRRTRIRFSIEDETGQTLRRDPKDGADLSRIEASALVLRAELSTSDPGQTPILHSWSVCCEGDTPPAIVSAPFPEQAAALSEVGGKAESGVVL